MPWPQQAQNPALKMHITSLLDFALFYFFPQRAAVIYSHQTGLLPCSSPAHVSLQSPYPEDEENLAPGTCTPRPLQATREPCKLQPQATENPGHRKTASKRAESCAGVSSRSWGRVQAAAGKGFLGGRHSLGGTSWAAPAAHLPLELKKVNQILTIKTNN